METKNEQIVMQQCQQTKAFVSQHIKEYIVFAVKTLDNEDFIRSATSLLPFDNFTDAKLRFMDDKSLVKSLGVSLMKMDMDSAKYALGIKLEIDVGEGREKADTVTFITGGHTIEGLKDFVRSDQFAKEVKIQFEEVIEGCFFSKKEK